MRAAIDRPAEFCGEFGDPGELLELITEVVDQNLAMLEVAPRARPWGAYLAVESTASRIVGTCAFKFGLSELGETEIAYFTFPTFEGQGYAGQMVAAMIRIAEAHPGVCRLLAHTLPEVNASGRVLQKSGFQKLGEFDDPEDGPVWRWALPLGAD